MYIRVHAVPKARKERVVQIDATTLEIHVKEPAERNLANTRIREIVGNVFKVPVAQVRILTGHRSSSKMFSIEM
jgi:uncharacterized protein YggU (UPF0235/DUF167 family)